MLKTMPNKGEVKRLLTVRRTRMKNKEREKVAEEEGERGDEEGGEEEMIRKGNAKTWNQPRLSRCRQTGQEEREGGLEQEDTRGGRSEEKRRRKTTTEKKRLEGSPRQGPLLRKGI